ncbi:MAG: tetratricopeptide repeat protein [Deltaproteobacteria bacterium]|nr:tetratricopeptide repeat protein [Deltaproteobacteria bacterium]
MISSLRRLGIPTVISEAKIIHYGYSDREETRKKLERNRSILERELAQNPKNVLAIFFLSRTLMGLGEIDSAQRYMDEIFSLAERDRSILHSDIFSVVILEKVRILCSKGDLEKAQELLRRYEPIVKKTDLYNFTLGEIYHKMGKYEEVYMVLRPIRDSTFRNEILPVQNTALESI